MPVEFAHRAKHRSKEEIISPRRNLKKKKIILRNSPPPPLSIRQNIFQGLKAQRVKRVRRNILLSPYETSTKRPLPSRVISTFR